MLLFRFPCNQVYIVIGNATVDEVTIRYTDNNLCLYYNGLRNVHLYNNNCNTTNTNTNTNTRLILILY